jgi:hypothetical protein
MMQTARAARRHGDGDGADAARNSALSPAQRVDSTVASCCVSRCDIVRAEARTIRSGLLPNRY